MKGKKLVFAVILSLIVCLLLLPTCAYASDVDSDTYNPEDVLDTTPSGGDMHDVPDTPSESDPPAQPEGNNDDGQNPPSGDGAALDENKGDSDKDSTDNDEGGDTDDTDADTDEGDSDADSDADDNDTHDDDADADTSDDSDDGDDEDESDSTDEPDKGNSENNSTSDPANTGDAGSSQTDSSSNFMVEFSYNGKSHKLENLKGNEQFGLAEILNALGIVGNIDDAKGDADELFAAESGKDGWKITTKKAFNTKQTMTVVVNGVEYVLDVIDDLTVTTVDQLKAAVAAGGNIALGADITDITGTIHIAAGKTVTIDLKGFTLSSAKGAGNHVLSNEGTLCVKDTSDAKTGKVVAYGNNTEGDIQNTNIALVNKGTATLEGGTFTHLYGHTNNAQNSVVLENYGTLILKSGTVIDGNNVYKSLIENMTNAELVIDGAVLKNAGQFAVNNKEKGSILIEDATVENTWGFWNENGTIVINGGRFDSTASESYVVSNRSGGSLTINGGTLIAADGYGVLDLGTGTTTITGGTFNSDVAALTPRGNNVNNGGTVTVSGGTFNTKLTSKAKDEWPGLNLVVNGGVSTDASAQEYVDLGSEIVTKSGEKYAVGNSVLDLAKTGETVDIIWIPDYYKAEDEVIELDVPAGVTFVNKAEKPININGVIINPGESYTTPTGETVTIAPVTTATTGEVQCAKYFVVDGEDQEWTKGSTDGLKYELNADANGVIKVLVDGVEVEFTVENGEIVISAEVLEKLDAGEHEIEFVFADGSCKTEFVIK